MVFTVCVRVCVCVCSNVLRDITTMFSFITYKGGGSQSVRRVSGGIVQMDYRRRGGQPILQSPNDNNDN